MLLLAVAALLLWRRHKHKQSTTAGDIGLISVSLQNDDLAENFGSVGDKVCQHESKDEVSAPDLTVRWNSL